MPALKVGDRVKRGFRYVEVVELSSCGKYAKVRKMTGRGEREWCSVRELREPCAGK